MLNNKLYTLFRPILSTTMPPRKRRRHQEVSDDDSSSSEDDCTCVCGECSDEDTDEEESDSTTSSSSTSSTSSTSTSSTSTSSTSSTTDFIDMGGGCLMVQLLNHFAKTNGGGIEASTLPNPTAACCPPPQPQQHAKQPQLPKEDSSLPSLPEKFSVATFRGVVQLVQHMHKTKKLYKHCRPLMTAYDEIMELDAVVGQDKFKDQICKHIIASIRGHKHLRHMVFRGPPGTGKTMIAHIIAKVFAKLDGGHPGGQRGKVIIGNRSNMIGSYVGQTAKMTRSICESARGGVLFIDEAYSLAGSETFSQTCIDTLNECLSQYDQHFICILAGYQNSMERLFAMNEGLRRRFALFYTLESYQPCDLTKILMLMVRKHDIIIDSKSHDTITSIFKREHKKRFKFAGGSIKLLLDRCIQRLYIDTFGRDSPAGLTLSIKILKDEIENFDLHMMGEDQSEMSSIYL